MKKNLFLLVFILAITSAGYSQKQFAGIIKSQITIEGTTDANITSQFPIEAQTIILGNKQKTDMVTQGIGITNILDGDKMTTTTILDLSIANYGTYYETKPIDLSKYKYEYTPDKSVTREIAGYNCYKVSSTITDLETDEVTLFEFYVSDDFLQNFKSTSLPGFSGFPLCIINEANYAGETYKTVNTVINIKPDKKIKPVQFLLPDGAKSFDEMPSELKAMFMGNDDSDE